MILLPAGDGGPAVADVLDADADADADAEGGRKELLAIGVERTCRLVRQGFGDVGWWGEI